MLETLKHIITILSCATYDYFFYDFMNYNFLKKQKGNYFVYFSILVFINVIINFFESTF